MTYIYKQEPKQLYDILEDYVDTFNFEACLTYSYHNCAVLRQLNVDKKKKRVRAFWDNGFSRTFHLS